MSPRPLVKEPGTSSVEISPGTPHSALDDASVTPHQHVGKLSGASDGDLVGLDGAGGVKRVPKDTFEQVQDTALTVTVGTGGDHATISAALAALSRLAPIFRSNGLTVEVSLLGGFVMAEQVVVRRHDLSWVSLTSVDATVSIDRSALATNYGADNFPAFAFIDGACSPYIDVLFDMDSSGAATDRNGFHFLDGARGTFSNNSGCLNAGERGLDVHHGSIVEARQSDFSGALSVGVRPANSSIVDVQNATATGCGYAAISVGGGCLVHADGFDGSASSRGIRAFGSGIVFALNASLSGCVNLGATAIGGAELYLGGANTRMGVSDAAGDTVVASGGTIHATGLTGGLSQAANWPTSAGTIYDENAPDSSLHSPSTNNAVVPPGSNFSTGFALGADRVGLAGVIYLDRERTLDGMWVEVTSAGDGTAVIRLGTAPITAGEVVGEAVTEHGAVDGTTVGVGSVGTIGATVGPGRVAILALVNGESTAVPQTRTYRPSYGNIGGPLALTQVLQGAGRVSGANHAAAMPATVPLLNSSDADLPVVALTFSA